jgi:hypothetical protein
MPVCSRSSALITQGAPRQSWRAEIVPLRMSRSTVIGLMVNLAAASSNVNSPRSARSPSRYTAISCWLRNVHTRDWVQPLSRPVRLPARFQHRSDRLVRHQPGEFPHKRFGLAIDCPTVLARFVLLDREHRVVAALPVENQIDLLALDTSDDLVQHRPHDAFACCCRRR